MHTILSIHADDQLFAYAMTTATCLPSHLLCPRPVRGGRPRKTKLCTGVPRSHATATPTSRSKGQKSRSRGQLVQCADISQTDKATPFKFGTHIGRGQFLPPDHKLALSGRGLGYVTQFQNFGTPSIFRKRVKLRSSNLTCT